MIITRDIFFFLSLLNNSTYFYSLLYFDLKLADFFLKIYLNSMIFQFSKGRIKNFQDIYLVRTVCLHILEGKTTTLQHFVTLILFRFNQIYKKNKKKIL